MANQLFIGKLEITADEQNFSINDGGGAQALALTTGNYYLFGYSGESSNQLCEHMQALIQALGGNYAGMTVAYDTDTNAITIDCDGTTTSITWTDTSLRDLLGFSSNLSGATSYTATYAPRYLWRPSRALSDYPTSLASPGPLASNSTTRVFRSNDGTLRSVEGHELWDGQFLYELLDKSEIKEAEADHKEALETFWSDVIAKGRQIRFFRDRTSLTASTDFVACKWAPLKDGTMGKFSDFAKRFDPGYDGDWNIQFELWKDV